MTKFASRYHSQLCDRLISKTFRRGELIIRKSHDRALSHFLVSGKVEIRESFELRYELDATDSRCREALEKGIHHRATVRAADDCEVLIAHNEYVDQLLSWDQDFTIFYLDEGDLALGEHDLIDDSFHEDWDNRFIQSALAANLSNLSIHKLLSALEDVDVRANDVVVRQNSRADYFYIIKQGTASVVTDPHGPFQGQAFELSPGDYFGDEALVAGTLRNATVRMTSDGVLGRLDAATFNSLIRHYLVSPMDSGKIDSERVRVVDVRLPFEFAREHYRDSQNIPISELRKHLDRFRPDQVYIIAPENDCRSELATYLMRQAGFDAYPMTAG